MVARSRQQVRSISARKPTPAIENFKTKINQVEKSISPPDPAQFVDFTGDGPFLYGSHGFEGCTGVVIASAKGAILGHWTSTPNDLERATGELQKLWDDNKDALNGATAVVYAQVETHNNENYVEPDMVEKYTDLVKTTTGLDPQMQSYVEPMETWVDEDGMPLDDIDYDNLEYGGYLVENEGGGSANTVLTFIDVESQFSGVEPNV